MTRFKILAAGLVTTAAVAIPYAWAAGLWATLPIVGGQAYCAATVVQSGAQQTITTTGGLPAQVPPPGMLEGFPGNPPGPNPVVCQSRVPAGPAVFAGTENVPADIYPPGSQIMAGGAQTALIKVTQLGQGALLDVNMPVNPAGSPISIPANVGFVVLDTGADATATVNLPSPAIDGQMITIACNGGAATSLTVAAVAPQVIVPPPVAGACPIGTITKYRFVAAATGALAANTWLRIQ